MKHPLLVGHIILFCLLSGILGQPSSIAEESIKNTNEGTIEEELGLLEEKLIEIEETIANLNIGINTVKENLTIFLIKKDPSFEVTYLELIIRDKSWYKYMFTPEENKLLEEESIGKMLTKLFWGDIKMIRSKVKIRCFYRMKDDKSRKEHKIIEQFDITQKTKISNVLSITLQRTVNRERNKKDVEIDVSFW